MVGEKEKSAIEDTEENTLQNLHSLKTIYRAG